MALGPPSVPTPGGPGRLPPELVCGGAGGGALLADEGHVNKHT